MLPFNLKKSVACCLLLLASFICNGQTSGGETLGYAVHEGTAMGTGETEPCPMFSIVKFPQALFVCERMQRSGRRLDETITVRKSRLMKNTWSPMLARMGDKCRFSYAELLALSLQESDNNACDLLFCAFGKPRKVERYMKRLGFEGISVGATERQMMRHREKSSLNSSTPKDMVGLLEWFYQHREDNGYLSYVWELMANCQTGTTRIPSALSSDDVIVHKTGTGFPTDKGVSAINDAGIIIHPDGTHSVIALFALNYPDTEQAEASIRRQAATFLSQWRRLPNE